MELQLTNRQFRRLLDMAYIGNWVLNATRGEDRFRDYDEVESLLFARAAQLGMPTLAELWDGEVVPSRAFSEGGIHEAIADYEDAVFYDILAEELSRRDMEFEGVDAQDFAQLSHRVESYLTEFEAHGVDRLQIDTDAE